MDPNETLNQLRESVKDWYANTLPVNSVEAIAELGRVIELVQAMDDWLSKGGFLPNDWGLSAFMNRD
ncbi:hypothetical protein UFOVP276_204 [uncultured Caudovirales phage]|uniref:Uncharacterized protein n=1 Tax=uncultured Caudovirales phage TaxID=2100421 RepID=A0A6J5LII8_9CAUD|nr:hypothetical protein UFOVP127_98 [uncultured Caudovirales phage]CAB4135248.1 hypothetical protein UFOVP276_204 [uncultured Caudovirales phage]